jgi:hypothetical protein
MKHAAWIFLPLVFGLAATGHGQDLNAEITGAGFGAPETDRERI